MIDEVIKFTFFHFNFSSWSNTQNCKEYLNKGKKCTKKEKFNNEENIIHITRQIYLLSELKFKDVNL